jgi:hypothetical protein
MENTSDFSHQNREHMLKRKLADLRNYNFIDSFPPDSNVSYIVPIQNRNLANLKNKIDQFTRQYPNIINDIKNHFYDNILEYVLKKLFDPSYTENDANRTNRLLKKFFIKYENHIQFIFNYFYDDLKPIVVKRYIPHLQFLYPFINQFPKSTACTLLLTSLKSSGALRLTSLMYPNQMNSIRQQDKNLSKKTSSYINKYLLLLFFFILLCILFGSEIFRFLLYYLLGLICTVFAVYLFVEF